MCGNSGGYALPASGTVAGTYTWHAAFGGDGNNHSANDQGGAAEGQMVNPASPMLLTTAGLTITLGNGMPLTDSGVLSAGYNPTGTITFTLNAPDGSLVYTNHVTVSGNATYTTSMG